MTLITRRLRAYLCAFVVLLPILVSNGIESHAQTDPTAQQSEVVLRVYFHDTAERDRIAAELSAEEVPTLDGYLTVIGDSDTYTRLVARGLHVEVDQAHTSELSKFNSKFNVETGALEAKPHGGVSAATQESAFKLQSPATFYGGYLTVAGIEAFYDATVAAYPDLVEKVDIGDSWCKTHQGKCTKPFAWNGYDLWALHITNRSISGPKPVFWLEAGIHSREVATPEVAVRFVSYLLDSYNTDADAHWLVDQHDIWVMPLVNPDGHLIVENGTEQNVPYFQRKNANDTNGCTIFPPRPVTQFGTDLNRNFPFKWGCCNGSSLTTCDQTYRGPAENSEEETQAITAKIRQLVPDQRGPADTDAAPITTTGVYQDLHSFADLNLYPWGWETAPAPNGNDLKNIAAHMSAQSTGGNGYKYCPSPACLYVTDGTAVDWGYGELGLASFSTELSGGSFFPDFSEVPNLWESNRGMLLYLAKIARTPYLTTRGPDANNVVASLDPVIQGEPGQITATINYDWAGNTYTQDVAAAEYYVDTPPWAGGTAVQMLPLDDALNSPTEVVTASVDTTRLAPGRHIIYVRGRGVNSYEGLQSWGPVSAAWVVVAPLGPSLKIQGISHHPNGARPGR